MMSKTFFSSLADFINRAHRPILISSLALTAISIVLISQLRIDSSLDSLLPSTDHRAQELLSDLQDAGTQDVLIVLITVPGPDQLDEGKTVVDDFLRGMADVPSIGTLEARISAQQQRFFSELMIPNASLFLSDDDRQSLLDRLSDQGIYQQVQENKRFLLMPMQGRTTDLILRDPLGLRTYWLSRWLSDQTFSSLDMWDGYLVDKEHKNLLVFIRPKESARNIQYTKLLMTTAHAAAESAIRTWRESHASDDVPPRIAFAGGYPIAFQDEDLTRTDLRSTLIVSLVGVNLLFFLVFQDLRILFLMLVPLAMGITWTFGSLRLVFGHVNILTGTFGGVLLGLGTDFAIYFLNFYLTAVRTEEHGAALRSAFERGGSGLVAGGVTSAAGFFTLGISSFRGFQELGIITGMGLIFCLLSMLIVLPALLSWQSHQGKTLQQVRPLTGFGLTRLFAAVQTYPRSIVALSLALFTALGFTALGVSFDDDLRSLRPRHSDQNSPQQQLESLLGSASGYVLLVMEGENDASLLNRSVLLNSALDSLLADGTLSHYRSALSYLPAPEGQHNSISFFERHAPDLVPKRIGSTFRRALEENGFQYLPEYDSYLEWLKTMLQPHATLDRESFERMGLASLLDPFIVEHQSNNGRGELTNGGPEHGQGRTSHTVKLLTYVYPKAGLWLKNDLSSMLADLERSTNSRGLGATEWRVGGFAVLSAYLKQQVAKDLRETVLLACLAIFFLVFIAFRHPLTAALAAIPLVAALVAMLGIMSLTSIQFNYANFIILPIMIGICINDGVLLMSYRRRERELPLENVFNDVGRAVLLTSLTTLMGFGSLVCCHYPGLRSIGFLSGLGILTELCASLILLPAVLIWMEQRAIHLTAR